MSFERFGSSDVYIFEHVGGFIECCGCLLSDWNGEEQFPQLKTPREALAHLDRHEEVGHDIGEARRRIKEEYENLDAPIEPYVEDPEVVEKRRARLKELFPDSRFRDVSNGE